MMTKLDDLSVAIGALQEGQRRAEISRVEHSDAMRKQAEHIAQKLVAQERKHDERFEDILLKLEHLTKSIDARVEKATKRMAHGALGGAGIVIVQYISSHLGLKFPFGEP